MVDPHDDTQAVPSVVRNGIIQDVEYPEPVDQHQELAEYLWNLGIALTRAASHQFGVSSKWSSGRT